MNTIDSTEVASLNNVEIDSTEEQLNNMENKIISKKRYLILITGLIITILVGILLAVLFGFVFNHVNSNKDETSNNSKTADLVVTMMEGPEHCLLDANCTSFAFNLTETERIREKFNLYDGNGDNEWAKDEFIKFYIESTNVNNGFDLMDIHNDDILSYKEAVVFFMLLSETSIFKEFLFPIYQMMIAKIYGYNTTIYNDQLFWEYAAELFFIELDVDQEGFVSKQNYFTKLGELEFDLFGDKDGNITFDEFLNSQFSEQGLDKYVNQNITLLSHDYHHLGYSLQDGHSLLSNLNLIHCLYSGIDFEAVKRRLLTLRGCFAGLAACAGTGMVSWAGCVAAWLTTGLTAGLTMSILIANCGGGGLVTFGVCYLAGEYCVDWLNANNS